MKYSDESVASVLDAISTVECARAKAVFIRKVRYYFGVCLTLWAMLALISVEASAARLKHMVFLTRVLVSSVVTRNTV